MEQLTEDKRPACTEFFWPQPPGSGDKNVFSSWYRKDAFHVGVLSLAFRKKRGGQSTFFVPAVFQVPLA